MTASLHKIINGVGALLCIGQATCTVGLLVSAVAVAIRTWMERNGEGLRVHAQVGKGVRAVKNGQINGVQ